MKEEEREEKIIEAFKEGLTYRAIQLRCGNPSKNEIKKVIQKNIPEIYEFINDTNKLKKWRDKI